MKTPRYPTLPEDAAFTRSGNGCTPLGGLTKREYFAAMAMQGFLADRDHIEKLAEDPLASPKVIQRRIAILSVNHADALITELNKETK